ncbi:MAG TPA: acetyl-CoA hydrolase/transferase C-terminal domain-containing protein [Spirochaetota bacterium]|nr:acetyl-CoA hydrolase/transferase C-terminal domain-containing protein [Spirochaetota bacterium]
MFKGKTGLVYNDTAKAVDDVLDYIGNDIIFGMTLALGKPILFINELYARAKQDPTIKLKIVTALALERPGMKSDLEKRFLGPLVERVFGGTPQFEYMLDFRAGKMPKNVEVYEFFNKAGGYMNSPEAQRNHLASNYTHVIRDAMDFGVNVFGQLVGGQKINGKMMYSMGCNTDICVEALLRFQEKRAKGDKVACIAEVNTQMPFMYGDAVREGKDYDILLQGEQYNYPLFGPPKDAVMLRDHMIGLRVSTLIKDGGTLQVGIGALGDAIAAGLSMRQNHNDVYNKVLDGTGLREKHSDLINKIGGTDKFDQGLYGSSEMFVDAFMQLYKSGVLKRKVYDDISIMKLVNAGKISHDKIPAGILELLYKEKGIHETITEEEFLKYQKFGIFKETLKYKAGSIYDGKVKYSADIHSKKGKLDPKKVLGSRLKHGKVILGAFFIGPRAFYNALNEMSHEEREQFGMSGVEKVNQLYGDEVLRSLQRKDGRFVNAGMICNVFGAIASDQTEEGLVVSGIGGQYNFVAMAHALPDARLVMMIRSTRSEKGGVVKSNIVYNYGHTSVTKHMRDIIVTEYGIADVRGKPDWQVIDAIIKIADSRFQDGLIEKAKKNGKLPQDYVLPAEYRQNTPSKIDAMLRPYQTDGHFVAFPFGTDLTAEEIALGASLKTIAAKKKSEVLKLLAKELFKPIPPHAQPFLARMGLDNPQNRDEKIKRKIVLAAMRAANRLHPVMPA